MHTAAASSVVRNLACIGQDIHVWSVKRTTLWISWIHTKVCVDIIYEEPQCTTQSHLRFVIPAVSVCNCSGGCSLGWTAYGCNTSYLADASTLGSTNPWLTRRRSDPQTRVRPWALSGYQTVKVHHATTSWHSINARCRPTSHEARRS